MKSDEGDVSTAAMERTLQRWVTLKLNAAGQLGLYQALARLREVGRKADDEGNPQVGRMAFFHLHAELLDSLGKRARVVMPAVSEWADDAVAMNDRDFAATITTFAGRAALAVSDASAKRETQNAPTVKV